MNVGNEKNFSDFGELSRQMIEYFPAPAFIADADGFFRFINRAAKNLFGEKAENPTDKNILDFLHPEQKDEFLNFKRQIPVLKESKAEFKILKNDGNFLWCEFHARILPDGNWQGFLTDVSAKKYLEEQLKISEERYKIITETALDAIICLDEHSQIVFVNKAAERIFGYQTSELVGHSISKIIPENLREKHFQSFSAYLKTGKRKTNWNGMEIPALRSNGEIFHIEISLGEYKQDENHYFIGIARDINNRREIEKATAHLAAIVEDSDDAIISKDLDGIITSWNKGAENLFGYKADEAIGNPVTILIPEQYLNEEPLILNRIKNGEKIEHYETIRKTKDGKLVEISLTISPIKDSSGIIIGASKIARDISERKRTENELRESQMILALAMSSSRMGVWEHDSKTDIVQWSPELEEIFGFEKGEFKQSRSAFYELIHEDDREKVFYEVESAVREKRDYVVEFRFLHKDGSIRWMEGRGKALYAADGSTVRLYGSGLDITERKLSEEKIKESERLFRTMADNISHFAWMADEKGSLYWYNQRWFEYTGTTLEEMRDWGWKKVLHPEYDDRVVKRFQKSLDIGENWEDTFPLRSKTGKYRWFLSRALPIRDEAGNIIRWFGTNTDITDRMEAEEALLTANRSKDEFLSVLSHELRTPLNSILGWMRILKTKDLDEAQTKRALDTIERNARLQCNLIEDLLDVSRIISRKLRIEENEVNLVSVVSSAVEIVQPLADAKQIKLEFKRESDPVIINGDQYRLEQIVVNLANNAIKFTPSGGFININLKQTGATAILEIIDTGIGIKTDFLPKIFDRFSQADSTTQRNYAGLGLGLTIVKHLTELHGGTISVFSEGENLGAKFVLEFPLFEREKPEGNFSDSESRPVSGEDDRSFLINKEIILVDDDYDGIEPLQILLETNGANVHCFDSAFSALKFITENKYDLLISDIGMPEFDGYQLVKKVSEINGKSPIPSIALTAYAGAEDRQRAIEAGFLYHIPKPIDYDLFLKTVRMALDSNNGGK